MQHNYRRLKLACYTTNLAMSIVGNLSPLLFMTFRTLYGLSYSLLGLLVLVNFFTQLLIDLVFTFFSHKFNISKVVKVTPALTALGLAIYAILPTIFPQFAYLGLVLGTVVFSASAGLVEVLLSPVIAAIPSDKPDKEMSKFHSIYAWGVVAVVIVSTVFLLVFGTKSWYLLALIFCLVPLLAAALFGSCKVPKIDTPHEESSAFKRLFNKRMLLCVLCIFLGGATECTMAQWSSGYIEKALQIPKIWGDVFGVALFAAMLGAGRTLYTKFGKNINFILMLGSIGSVVCYITAAVSNVPIIGLLACALTGLCTSMLWPGNLIFAGKRFPAGGVAMYALMAAGGDLGASVGPQLVGIVTDSVMKQSSIIGMAAAINISPEQLAIKIGLISAVIFPILGSVIYFAIWQRQRRNRV